MAESFPLKANGISSNPDIMGGKPCVAGTRITVEAIVRRFAEGYSLPELLSDYPLLTKQDVDNALDFCADLAAQPSHELA